MKNKKSYILYLISPKIKWSTFKLLQKKLVKDSGPTPVELPKVLWGMVRERQILCWFAEDMPNDMGIGLEIPKRYKKWTIKVISSKVKE